MGSAGFGRSVVGHLGSGLQPSGAHFGAVGVRQRPEFRRQNFQRVQPARPVAAARPQPAPLTYGIAWAVAVCACPGESVLRGPGCVPRWCARDGPDRRPTCPSRVSPRCERGPGFHPRLPARSAGRGAQAAPVSGSLPRAATGPPMPRHAPPAPSGPHPARWGPIENAGVRDHPSRWRARVRGGWLLGLRPFVHCWAERSHARALHSTRECTAEPP